MVFLENLFTKCVLYYNVLKNLPVNILFESSDEVIFPCLTNKEIKYILFIQKYLECCPIVNIMTTTIRAMIMISHYCQFHTRSIIFMYANFIISFVRMFTRKCELIITTFGCMEVSSIKSISNVGPYFIEC